MAEVRDEHGASSIRLDPSERLDSWKEIAVYLQRGVRTVRRWEKREGLPVHRHLHQKQATVYAYRSEIDAWLAERGDGLEEKGGTNWFPLRPMEKPGGGDATTARPIHWRWLLPLILVGALVLVIAAWSSSDIRPGPFDSGSIRFSVHTPEGKILDNELALSPDGRHLAFPLSSSNEPSMIWVRSMDSLEARPLPGTERGSGIFWSPDSRFIGFFSDGQLKKLDINGGPPYTLCSAPTGQGGSWNREGVIIFATQNRRLQRVSEDGSLPEVVLPLDETRLERAHFRPQFLPDGRHFLYLSENFAPDKSAIYIGSLDSQETQYLLNSDLMARYASGHLLFMQSQTLMGQPFDASTFELMGRPFVIAEDVGNNSFSGIAAFSASENGVLSYRHGKSSQHTQLTWLDRSGDVLGTVGPPGGYGNATISPDGRRVAAERRDWGENSSDIWIFDVSGQKAFRLTLDPANEQHPTWSPDGTRIVYSTDREGPRHLYQIDSRGAGEESLFFKSDRESTHGTWSADGRFFTYLDVRPETRADLSVLRVLDGGEPTSFLQTTAIEAYGEISPDGKWMVYGSDESSKWEVYVQPFPPTGAKWQISTGTGIMPTWRQDGKEIFYFKPFGRELMAVPVELGDTFDFGVPRPLFSLNVNALMQRNSFDVSSDGERFLVPVLTPAEDNPPVTVIMNWTAETASD